MPSEARQSAAARGIAASIFDCERSEQVAAVAVRLRLLWIAAAISSGGAPGRGRVGGLGGSGGG